MEMLFAGRSVGADKKKDQHGSITSEFQGTDGLALQEGILFANALSEQTAVRRPMHPIHRLRTPLLQRIGWHLRETPALLPAP